MDSIPKIIFQNLYFNGFAGFASIAGFVITIFVLFNVRNIKGFYTKKIRLPKLLPKLKKNAENLLSELNPPVEDYKLKAELGKTEENLKALQKNVDKNINSQCKIIIHKIAKILKYSIINQNEVRDVHAALQKIIEAINNLQDDLKMEMYNGH